MSLRWTSPYCCRRYRWCFADEVSHLCFIGRIVGVASSFPDFSYENIKWNAMYLVLVLIITRVITFIALGHLNYRAT